MIILTIVMSIISILLWSHPASTVTSVDMNEITQETKLDYEVKVLPHLLHPSGGWVKPEQGLIFDAVSTVLKLKLTTEFSSRQPITWTGEEEVTLSLVAPDLWKKDIPLRAKKAFEVKEQQQYVITGSYEIQLAELLDAMEQVENQLRISPAEYVLEVKPRVTGLMIHGEYRKAIAEIPPFVFKHRNNMFTFEGEQAFQSSDVETTQETMARPIELAGVELPVTAWRYGSTAAALLLLIYSVRLLGRDRPATRYSSTERLERFERKYEKRWIRVAEPVPQQATIRLLKMEELLKLADERDLPILMYRMEHSLHCYIMDHRNTYWYSFGEDDQAHGHNDDRAVQSHVVAASHSSHSS
ncbi:DUF5305 family protein [Paenibacillus sp. GCM10023252]|uniref:DUF5305 family protein n=1 Tax=Paenibacillus sp. GCM10023252 TaxID=3252649 RepID=UPI00361A8BA4